MHFIIFRVPASDPDIPLKEIISKCWSDLKEDFALIDAENL